MAGAIGYFMPPLHGWINGPFIRKSFYCPQMRGMHADLDVWTKIKLEFLESTRKIQSKNLD